MANQKNNTEDDLELQSCPFCGSKKIECGHKWSCGDGYVRCKKCGGMTSRNSMDEAIEAWTNRTPTDYFVELKYPTHV
tara:strand:+ start:405 stop:638 length:234 start_codon:yes stop_codon:yes gene_type:complete